MLLFIVAGDAVSARQSVRRSRRVIHGEVLYFIIYSFVTSTQVSAFHVCSCYSNILYFCFVSDLRITSPNQPSAKVALCLGSLQVTITRFIGQSVSRLVRNA